MLPHYTKEYTARVKSKKISKEYVIRSQILFVEYLTTRSYTHDRQNILNFTRNKIANLYLELEGFTVLHLHWMLDYRLLIP